MSSAPLIIKPIVLSRQLLTMRNIAPELYEYGTAVRDAINSLSADLSALSSKSIVGIQSNPVIQQPQFTDGPYNESTSIISSSISSSAPTLIMQTSVLIPTTGGPFRILASYSLFLSSSNALNGIDTWVSDGTNIWAPFEYFQNSGQNGSTICAHCAMMSRNTYQQGAGTITISLFGIDTHSGSTITAVTGQISGPGVSILQAEAIRSN